MNLNEFKHVWEELVPGLPAVPHAFKHAFPDRWLRVFSLPDSKRYADSEEEWSSLLSRQNNLLTLLIGDQEPFWLITGDFLYQGAKTDDLWPRIPALEEFDYQELEPFDLAKWDPEFYVEGWAYQAKVAQGIWQTGAFDPILREIADDRARAIFLPFAGNVLIAPYDGGIDLIFASREERAEWATRL